MSSEPRARWTHYADVDHGAPVADRFTNYWKASAAFGAEISDLGVIEIAPGERGPRHSHEAPIEEYYVVLDGEIDVVLDDRTVTGGEGTVFFFPPGSVHYPVNTSGDRTLLLSFRALGSDGVMGMVEHGDE